MALGVLEGSANGGSGRLGPGPGQKWGGAGGCHRDLEHLLTLDQSQQGPDPVQRRLCAPLAGQETCLQLQAFLSRAEVVEMVSELSSAAPWDSHLEAPAFFHKALHPPQQNLKQAKGLTQNGIK